MTELAKLFLPAAVCTAAAGAYALNPSRALLVARLVCGSILLIWLALLTTGMVGDPRTGPHRFLAHFFIMVVWCLLPLLAGTSIGAAFQAGRWLRLTHAVLPVLALGVSFLAAFSGYMVRDAPTADQIIRFHVLHKLAFPAMVGLLLFSWIWVTRRYASPAA